MRYAVQDHAVSARLEAVLVQAAHDAGEQLSAFMERDVRLHGTSAQRVRLEDVPSALHDRDGLVTAMYLGFTGDLDGHVMLAFAPEIAAHMAATLLMELVPLRETLGPMETSALGEVGNITASSFLTSVASACHLAVGRVPPRRSCGQDRTLRLQRSETLSTRIPNADRRSRRASSIVDRA